MTKPLKFLLILTGNYSLLVYNSLQKMSVCQNSASADVTYSVLLGLIATLSMSEKQMRIESSEAHCRTMLVLLTVTEYFVLVAVAVNGLTVQQLMQAPIDELLVCYCTIFSSFPPERESMGVSGSSAGKTVEFP